MKSATLLLIAALSFAGVAISTGWRDAYPTASCPPPDYTIRYLPVPEPQPIYPRPKLTMADLGPTSAAEAEEVSSQRSAAGPLLHASHLIHPTYRHHRTHHRLRRRR